MTGANLGRMERVDLRTIWTSESGDFTPWLGKEENLKLLGETIDLELECEAQEKEVGPFRADILCKEITTGHWVLIENQLERTDHTHLGQLLTYAAGLKAVTIVWIANPFTEEHRAALDWLNEITDERFNFFGLEVELWRIGNSPVAPKFNVVCKPNNWAKRAAQAAEGELSETSQLYLEYWQAFKEYLETKKGPIQIKKPLPQTWMTYALGRSNFYLASNISRQKCTAWVQLVIYGPDHVAYLKLLQKQAPAIEAELGKGIEWRELPEGKESHVRRSFEDWDPDNRKDWPRQFEELRKALEQLRACFAHRVKVLSLSENGETTEPPRP